MLFEQQNRRMLMSYVNSKQPGLMPLGEHRLDNTSVNLVSGRPHNYKPSRMNSIDKVV